VSDEFSQLSRRHVEFDMNELAKTAATAIGTKKCVSVEKCPDGLYNKEFIFTVDDGRKVIGKIPNSNAEFIIMKKVTRVSLREKWKHFDLSDKGIEIMKYAESQFGELWPEKGLVPHDQYDEAKVEPQSRSRNRYSTLGFQRLIKRSLNSFGHSTVSWARIVCSMNGLTFPTSYN
jgi:hypothetical protein